jgi:hypothetical protein
MSSAGSARAAAARVPDRGIDCRDTLHDFTLDNRMTHGPQLKIFVLTSSRFNMLPKGSLSPAREKRSYRRPIMRSPSPGIEWRKRGTASIVLVRQNGLPFPLDAAFEINKATKIASR